MKNKPAARKRPAAPKQTNAPAAVSRYVAHVHPSRVVIETEKGEPLAECKNGPVGSPEHAQQAEAIAALRARGASVDVVTYNDAGEAV